MKILDVLSKESIVANLISKDKKGVLEELAVAAAKIANIDSGELLHVLMEREKLGSTGIGGGIGMPHGKWKNLNSLILCFGRSKEGVEFEAIDGKPANIFFLLVTPENSSVLHLKILAQISRFLKNDIFKERLLSVSDRDEIYNIIMEEDKEF